MQHGVFFFFGTDIDLDLLVEEIGKGNLIFKNIPSGNYPEVEWVEFFTDLVVTEGIRVNEDLFFPTQWDPQNITRYDFPFHKKEMDEVRNTLQRIKRKYDCYGLCLILQSSLNLDVVFMLMQANDVTLKNLPEGEYFEVLESPDRSQFFSVPSAGDKNVN